MTDPNTPVQPSATAGMEVEAPSITPVQPTVPAATPQTAQTPATPNLAATVPTTAQAAPAAVSTTPAPTTPAVPTLQDTVSSMPVPEEKKRDRRKDMPIRQYLDTTVVPVLLAGMSQLTKERPETDEIEWLANWMLKNNPNKKPKTGV